MNSYRHDVVVDVAGRLGRQGERCHLPWSLAANVERPVDCLLALDQEGVAGSECQNNSKEEGDSGHLWYEY